MVSPRLDPSSRPRFARLRVRSRALALVLLLAAACDEDEVLVPPAPPKKPPATRTDVAAAAKKRQDCRDACEQSAIIAGTSEKDMRACRARCDGQFAAPPVEAPRSITVAPPHTTPPAVRPR